MLTPEDIGATSGVLRVAAAREIIAGNLAKIFPAMLAVAHAGAVPSVDKDAVHAVACHDFFLHFGHELEIVGTQRASYPHFGRGPVAAWLVICVHGDPIRVRVTYVIVGGMRVGAGDHHHAQSATPGDQFAEWIRIAEPLTAVVERHNRRIIRDATAGAQTGRVGAGAFEVIEPELRIEFAGIIFNEGKLCPAHGPVDPVGRTGGSRAGEQRGAGQSTQDSDGTGGSRGFEKRATRDGRSRNHCGRVNFALP